eukprot:4475315-Amphidinium_carterae.1
MESTIAEAPIFQSVEVDAHAPNGQHFERLLLDPGYMHYSSVSEHEEEVRAEIKRLVEQGFCVRLPVAEARAMFSGGSISKLA